MSIRVLCLGEIVGKAGIFTVKNLLPQLRNELQPDFVIANGEGATGGFGIGKNHSIYLHKLGIDVITGGECIYYKRDMVSFINNASFILRAANFPPKNPGRGWKIYRKDEKILGVISLLGQSGFNRIHLSNPYTFLPDLVSRIQKDTKVIILDFHAATTAEKYTMFYHADGLVSAVVGTHFKALTSDEKILEKGTGVICDTGRTGSIDSVGGLDKEIEIQKFLTQIPERSQDAWGSLELQGVFLEIDEESGKCINIQRIRRKCREKPDERESNGS